LGYIGQAPANKVVTSADIEDGVVSAADLAANSVDSSELVDLSIDTSHIGALQVTGAKLNTDVISAQTALGAEPADTDEFMVSDAGVLKRIDYSLIKGGGITMLDQWFCTADQDFSADAETLITGSWGDFGTTDSGANIGSSMTESSGIFTFPSTGVYAIDWVIQIQGAAGTNDAVIVYMYVTTNDSTYTDAQDPGGFFGDASDRFPFTGHFALDVTDTANVKIKFSVYSATVNAQIAGNGSRMRSGVTFTRLGDT